MLRLASFPDSIQAFGDRIHPDDTAKLWSVVDQNLANREPFVHEFRLRHADGSYVWVRSRAKAIYSDTGEAIRLIGSTYDVSELKAAEADRERFFNTGIQHYGVADIRNGTWTRLSENWKELLGFEAEELAGTPYLDLAHPDDRKSYEQRMQELQSGKPVRGFLGRMRHNNGSYRWIEWSVSPPEPETSTVYFTARDVTDADHDVLRNIAEAVPMTLEVFDLQEQRLIFVNRHVESLIGYTSTEAMELGVDFIRKLLHPDDQSHL